MSLENLARILQEDCKFSLDELLVLGFSGGPDSLALLTAFHDLEANMLVAHLDHGLRPESAEELLGAKEIVEKLGLPFFGQRVDAGMYARERSQSIEEAARELRYQFLFRVAAENGAAAVAVAHNADDQVETVLMHLLRGAGPRGLKGMQFRFLPNPWSQTIPLIRPLLGNWRQEILDFCEQRGLHPVLDPSNLDATFFRNRLRQALIPELEKFSPGFKVRLRQTANLLGAEAALVETLADEAWRRCLSWRGVSFLQLDGATLLSEPLALQRIILRRAVEELHPEMRDLGFDAIERALGVAHQPFSSPQDWVAGLYLLVEKEHLWIADWNADLPIDWPQAPVDAVHLGVPSDHFLQGGWRLSLRAVDQNTNGATENADPFQAWFDLDRVGDEVLLRRRRPGDRFQPLGLEAGTQKLADFMINSKLPQRARECWPLLCKDGEVIWVPGYRMAHAYRLRHGSLRVMHARLAYSERKSL